MLWARFQKNIKAIASGQVQPPMQLHVVILTPTFAFSKDGNRALSKASL